MTRHNRRAVFFNHNSTSATACMSVMFVAYLIIHPKATDPLN